MGEHLQSKKECVSMTGLYNSSDGSKRKKNDEDLIIEENTIYEIDRDCYERLKRQRKRKVQEKRNS